MKRLTTREYTTYIRQHSSEMEFAFATKLFTLFRRYYNYCKSDITSIKGKQRATRLYICTLKEQIPEIDETTLGAFVHRDRNYVLTALSDNYDEDHYQKMHEIRQFVQEKIVPKIKISKFDFRKKLEQEQVSDELIVKLVKAFFEQ